MNPYETLGVDKDATDAAIKAAYRKAARKHHPDRHGGDSSQMQTVNAAYEVLSDPARRKQYDETGSTEKKPSLEVTLFAALVEVVADEPGNIVNNMEREVSNAIVNGRKEIREAQKPARKLESRIAAVKGPADRNIIADVLRGRLRTLREAIETDEGRLEMLGRVHDMLREYTSSEANAKPQRAADIDMDELHREFQRMFHA